MGRILETIKNNLKVTRNELIDVTNLTRRSVELNLKKLKNAGLIRIIKE
ncbi:MAG: helix-turn-helix domain-containing protein [Candidatus Omnitrophica bacterium]|nr:helix-turn-helix domain-containing protein [Candidatus Omnitrophota bacterium]